MTKVRNEKTWWTVCQECKGRGKKSRRLRKKVKLRYQKALNQYEKSTGKDLAPIRPKAHLDSCKKCKGSGLVASDGHPIVENDNYPHIAIIGGGIGGVALAVACLHRGIPFTLYERDTNFEARSQGYGLTLQQASKAIQGLGLFSLDGGVVSTRHLVHTTDGKVIGEWGMRKWLEPNAKSFSKRTNVHIPRQALRLALLEQLGGHNAVKWGHQFLGFENCENKKIALRFQVDGEIQHSEADLIVGADGIRSSVRSLLLEENSFPLHYLGCVVILGICDLRSLQDIDSSLLDSATVFQTANGTERIYVMPYTSDSVMWQLSFPIAEKEAKALSAEGAQALKKEACRRTQWHSPIPQILMATPESEISGYPVYDRELITPELLAREEQVTLLGDAAHPMSPFKGQGANQALLDSLALARGISKGCNPKSNWREVGIRESVLNEFETEMLARSAIKVKDSAAAAEFLHSEIALYKADEPRGRCVKNKAI